MENECTGFRLWWQKPKRTMDLDEDRRVSFLELFYDLVYVVIISELTHAFAKNISLTGALEFLFLFIIVWWAWINGTIYHELHGNNDVRTRVSTFLQMMGVASMAVFAHSAFSDGFIGFALSFVFFQIIMMFLWWRTGVHDHLHRPLSRPYVATSLFASIAFFISIFFPVTTGLCIWGGAMITLIFLPILMDKFIKFDRQIIEERERTAHIRPSLVERFGLFTIIVLGEVIIGVVQGVAGHHHLDLQTFIIAGLSMFVGICMWWVYFDFISLRDVQKKNAKRYMWMYAHIPLTASIAAIGAGALNVVEHSGEVLSVEVRFLIVGSVILFLLCIIALMQTIIIKKVNKKMYKWSGKIIVLSVIFLIFVAALPMDTIFLLTLINFLMLLPVFAAVRWWVQRMKNMNT